MSRLLLLPIFLSLQLNCFSQPINDEVVYDYNSSGMIIEEMRPLSNGDFSIIRYRYANDVLPAPGGPECLNPPSAHLALSLLRSKNILNIPIETYKVVRKPSNIEYVVEGSLYIYSDTKPYPISLYKLDIAAPLQNFVPAIFGSCGISYSSNYVLEETYNLYDNYGNLLEMTHHSGVKASYIYDYNGAYKVAEITNASYNDVAYTSFEGGFYSATATDPDKGNWVFPPSSITTVLNGVTGFRSYNLSSGTLASRASSLAVGKKYRLSFWLQNGPITVHNGSSVITAFTTGITSPTGWVYKECEFTAQAQNISITGAAYIDEVRLCPVESMMKTYAYKPLVGVETECDASSHFVHYEYDQIGRLRLVTDQNGKVIKKMVYGVKATE